MISYFNNSQNDKFVLATASEISLYQIDGANSTEEIITDDVKPQNISKFLIFP